MGQFTFTLPDNQQADVRWGTERKINGFLDVLPWRKKDREERRGYIVKLDTGPGTHNVYRLFRTTEGQWQQQKEDETTKAIKIAIDNYEKRQESI